MSNFSRKLGFYGQILTAIGMATALSACGDTSGSDSTAAAAGTSSPALAGKASSSTTSTAATSSSASRVVDKSGTVWTLKSGVVYDQAAGASTAAPAGYSANVVQLYYSGGVVYQQNSACQWYGWSGGTWTAASAPSGAGACPNAAASSSASSSSSSSSSSGAASSSGSASGFGIKVTGATFTDLSGNVLQLQGENASGLGISYEPSMWDGFNHTSVTTWQTIASTWHMNIIRLDMNEYNWRVNPNSAGGTPYRTILINTVKNITAAGMYVILDLHWAAPNAYTGNLTGDNAAGYADGQPGYMDADNAPAVWASIAAQFKGNPAVLFELFNEPYADDTQGAWDSTRLNLLKNGGSFTFYDQAMGQGSPHDTGITYNVAGHQQLVTAIRNTGATNVILYSCPNWDNNPSQSLDVKPTDPVNQIAATVHYAGGTNADYTNLLEAGVPIIMTEFYSLASRGGYSWAQSNHIGYVMWGANNWNSNPDLSALISQAPWSYNSQSVAWPL